MLPVTRKNKQFEYQIDFAAVMSGESEKLYRRVPQEPLNFQTTKRDDFLNSRYIALANSKQHLANGTESGSWLQAKQNVADMLCNQAKPLCDRKLITADEQQKIEDLLDAIKNKIPPKALQQKQSQAGAEKSLNKTQQLLLKYYVKLVYVLKDAKVLPAQPRPGIAPAA